MTAWAPAAICAFKYRIVASASSASSRWSSAGASYIRRLMIPKVLLPPPSTMYVPTVQGLPANPISGTRPASSRRISATASTTYLSSCAGSGSRSLSISAADRIGRANFGPSPASKFRPRSIACGMVRMSENRIAASSGYRSIGCRVTSQAMSGLVHIARKLPARARVARYSGRYRPAWRMSQTGLRGVGSRSSARSSKSFLRGAVMCVRSVSWVTSVRWDRTGDDAPG